MIKKYTILFVDDEPYLQEALIAFLEDDNIQCVSTSNVTEAWKYMKSNEVAGLVTDIMMPGGKDFPDIDSSSAGFRLIDMVLNEFPNIGIVCLSVIGDQNKIDKLKRLNVLYLRKGETNLDKAIKTIKSKTTGIYEVK